MVRAILGESWGESPTTEAEGLESEKVEIALKTLARSVVKGVRFRNNWRTWTKGFLKGLYSDSFILLHWAEKLPVQEMSCWQVQH